MNAIFLRNLASKAPSKNKLDSRFQIFQEICEKDIEIESCEKVINFTKSSFSILNQDTLHVLIKATGQKDGELKMKQYKIFDDVNDKESVQTSNSPKRVDIQMTTEKQFQSS